MDETIGNNLPEGLELRRSARGLELARGTMAVRGDFTRMLARVKPGNVHRELIVRAAKVKGTGNDAHVGNAAPTAIDATAGLGEDALLLAAAGFEVRLYERNPIIAALLGDALERASAVPELAAIVNRMQLIEGESIDALPLLETPPDVVLLDPMFPGRQKDAAVKKKAQLLQQLERPCEDEAALFDAAISARPRKIVVKRPVKGPHLAGRKPSYSLAGKAIRFDCYALHQL